MIIPLILLQSATGFNFVINYKLLMHIISKGRVLNSKVVSDDDFSPVTTFHLKRTFLMHLMYVLLRLNKVA